MRKGRRHICMQPQSGGKSAVWSQEDDLKSAFEGLTLIFCRSAHLMLSFCLLKQGDFTGEGRNGTGRFSPASLAPLQILDVAISASRKYSRDPRIKTSVKYKVTLKLGKPGSNF